MNTLRLKAFAATQLLLLRSSTSCDSWQPLVQTIRSLRAPMLLAVSERRPGDIAALRAYLSSAKLESALVDSPMPRGYASEKVKLLWVDPPGNEQCDFWKVDADELGRALPEADFGVRCR